MGRFAAPIPRRIRESGRTSGGREHSDVIPRAKIPSFIITALPASLVHMHDFGRREAVEERAAGGGIGSYVFGVDQFAHLHVRELLGRMMVSRASHVGPKTEQI